MIVDQIIDFELNIKECINRVEVGLLLELGYSSLQKAMQQWEALKQGIEAAGAQVSVMEAEVHRFMIS